jgi:hypothetical protein
MGDTLLEIHQVLTTRELKLVTISLSFGMNDDWRSEVWKKQSKPILHLPSSFAGLFSCRDSALSS